MEAKEQKIFCQSMTDEERLPSIEVKDDEMLNEGEFYGGVEELRKKA